MSKKANDQFDKNRNAYEALWFTMLFFTIVLGIHFIYRIILVPTLQGTNYIDFQAYYAGSRALLEGENIYDKDLPMYFNMFGRDITFLYPPLAAVCFIPLTIFKYRISALLWLVFNLSLMIVIIDFFSKQKPLLNRRISILLLLTCVFIFWPIEEHIGGGQSCLIVLVFLLWCCKSIQKNNFILAGMMIALATHFRLMPGIFLIYFILKRQWHLSLWAAIWNGLLAAVAFVAIGYDLHAYYFENTIPYLLEDKAWFSNQAFNGFLYRLRDAGFPMSKETVISVACITKWIVLTGTLAYFFFRKKNFKEVVLEEVGFLLMVTLFVAGYTTTYYFVFCLLPLWMFRPDEKSETTSIFELVLFALAFTLISFPLGYMNPLLRKGIYNLWIPTKFYGLVILMYLALKKMVKEKNENQIL